MKKKLYLLIYFILLFIYEELIFHIFVFNGLTWNFLYVILLSIPVGAVFYILSNLFKTSKNRIPTYIFTGLTLFLFIANFIYNRVYSSIISIYSLLNGNQVLGFLNHIIKIAFENFYVLILMILPVVALIILDIKKQINFNGTKKEFKIFVLGCAIFLEAIALILINFINTNEIYSNKNLYSNIHSPLMTVERLGLVTMFRLDCQRTIFGFTEKDIDVSFDIPKKEEVKDKQLNLSR